MRERILPALAALAAAASPAAAAPPAAAYVEAGLLLPRGGFAKAARTGTVFSAGAQLSWTPRIALSARVGVSRLVGAQNDKLRVSLVPVDVAVKFSRPLESGFAPFVQLGAGYTALLVRLGDGREDRGDLGPAAAAGVDLFGDSGFGIGGAVAARTFLEDGAGSVFWTMEAGLRVWWRPTGKAVPGRAR